MPYILFIYLLVAGPNGIVSAKLESAGPFTYDACIEAAQKAVAKVAPVKPLVIITTWCSEMGTPSGDDETPLQRRK